MPPAAPDPRPRLAAALAAFGTQSLADAAIGLFDALGYRSDRRMKLRSTTAAGFLGTFDRSQSLNPARVLVPEWKTVEFLFQLTDAEVKSAALDQTLSGEFLLVNEAAGQTELTGAIGQVDRPARFRPSPAFAR